MTYLILLLVYFGQPGGPPQAQFHVQIPIPFASKAECENTAPQLVPKYEYRTDLPVLESGWVCEEKKGA